MDVQIIMTLRATSTDINQVADAVYDVVDKLVTGANIKREGVKSNALLSFQAVEIRPGSSVTKFFKFPNDLDKITPIKT